MKSDLSDKDFKDLEKKCLLLDILIDCEEYEEFHGLIFDTSIKGISRGTLCISEINVPSYTTIHDSIEQMRDKKVHEDSDKYDDYFEIIISSKYVRRLLNENRSNIGPKESDELWKELTEALIKQIPPKPDDKNINLSRIIFLNEISASSVGYLAKGYAEMALTELNSIAQAQNQNHPYELYALYNKGLALNHDPSPDNTEKAIETFNQILPSFKKQKNESSGKERPDNGGKHYSRNIFNERYANYKDWFDLFFWLIYVPTQHLMAEAYADLNASLNRENTVSEALDRIAKEEVKINNAGSLDKTISTYYEAKFALKLCLTKIDSGDFEKPLELEYFLKSDWLIAIKGSKNIPVLTNLNATMESLHHHLNINNELESTQAIFWKEYARISNDKSSKMVFYGKSYNLCFSHLSGEITLDWSDFAITFLESISNILDEDDEVWKMIFDKDDEAWEKILNDGTINGPKSIWACYEKILNILIDADWVQRKRELTERFLECQEKILSKPIKKGGVEEYGQYLDHQIKLVKKILDDTENRFFKKRWPEQEKENLKKSLQYYVNINKDIRRTERLEELRGIKIKKEDIFPDKGDLDDIGRFIGKKVNCDFYHKKWRSNSEAFYDHLIYKSCRPSLKDSYGLTVLRRWQSFTPALSSGSEVGEKGGGYFVYKTDEKGEIEEGLVIDPGFNFLENFFDEGFSIRDINAILLTHSHPDHSSDLMSVVTLVHEMNKRGKRVFSRKKWEDSKLVLFMTDGCFFKYAQHMGADNIKSFRDIIRVELGETYGEKAFLENFEVKVVKAIHNDQTDYDSVGFIISEKGADGNKGKVLIGFTGDTQWYPKIADNFVNCPVLCMNIGGVVDIFKGGNITLSDLCIDEDDMNKHRDNIKKILVRENHLYFPGFYLMANSLKEQEKKPKLLILSELCEEMKGGLRTDLAEKMWEAVGIPVLPEDIGLTVLLGPEKSSDSTDRSFICKPLDLQKKLLEQNDSKVGSVVCKACNSLKDPLDKNKGKNIFAVETSRDNAIFYLCKEHYRQLKEWNTLPKINELELDLNESRKPLDPENDP